MRIDRLDESTFVVSHVDPGDRDDSDPGPVATCVTVANGMVVAMQQYRSRDDALTASVASH